MADRLRDTYGRGMAGGKSGGGMGLVAVVGLVIILAIVALALFLPGAEAAAQPVRSATGLKRYPAGGPFIEAPGSAGAADPFGLAGVAPLIPTDPVVEGSDEAIQLAQGNIASAANAHLVDSAAAGPLTMIQSRTGQGRLGARGNILVLEPALAALRQKQFRDDPGLAADLITGEGLTVPHQGHIADYAFDAMKQASIDPIYANARTGALGRAGGMLAQTLRGEPTREVRPTGHAREHNNSVAKLNGFLGSGAHEGIKAHAQMLLRVPDDRLHVLPEETTQGLSDLYYNTSDPALRTAVATVMRKHKTSFLPPRAM